ncbi:tripartite ATP-independent transporter DctQ subunit [Loktanella sp. PT4BL]|jgi:TRAP-type C4-dicarboxylate transport system permease small subunit|uniref:TRAP transporter small permease n=1 Tax=Loktanella sp. PT4BL TaxID=2135611 RepID=UPI000D83323C|nr:TRAP transporter small permease [Loktanella sp. PT4BL]PXW67684.1 tripartite ATP-independent transporter DctQ subunit [Loktanella sp. PT4BL]
MLHRAIHTLANVMALLGGIVLCLLVLMVCVSVSVRELSDLAHGGALRGLGEWLIDLGVGPILGDFELVEAGVAFAIFAFLPLTQLSGAHARVDVFTKGLGPRVNAALSTFWTVVMAATIVLITWRLFAGMQDKIRYNETSYLIQFPIWWAYAASFGAAVTASIVSLYCAAMRLTGQRDI